MFIRKECCRWQLLFHEFIWLLFAGGCAQDVSSATNEGVLAAGSGAVAPAADPGSRMPSEFLGDAGDGWRTLIAGAWEIPGGQEGYRCIRATIPQDVMVNGLRPLAPRGTHHSVLSVLDTPDAPDGITECLLGTGGGQSIGGSGVGTKDFVMPQGVAMKIRAGQQLVYNAHLVNATEQPMRGVSGMLVKVMPAPDVKQIAEAVLAGPVVLDVPVGGPSVQTGECTMTHDVTMFAVLPHMHQLGTHMKVVAQSSVAGEVVMHDGAYDFEAQLVYPLAQEVPMKAGDKVRVECTYMNTSGVPVQWGERSQDEMCFAGLYRYPYGGISLCVQ